LGLLTKATESAIHVANLRMKEGLFHTCEGLTPGQFANNFGFSTIDRQTKQIKMIEA
jgi:hypothetical protein